MNGVFWPKDLLAKDMLDLRILILGFDSSKMTKALDKSTDAINEIALELLASLGKFRDSDHLV